ncbi:MAG: APC family permease [Pontimonas sp.]|nr:APC family permease [Pontimonas sp.]
MTGLVRRLGPLGASAIGLSSMIGAGVFYVWAPAAQRAGSWLLLALVIAGTIALLNALVMAQLSLQNPVSGGAYRFGQKYVSPRVGFLAGSLFLIGKTSSAGAIALVAARYLAPDQAPVVAAGLVALFVALNITGIRTTAGVSMVVVLLVLGVLVATLGVSWPATTGQFEWVDAGGFGVLQAAGLMFFAFAGYARMATLGDEVKNPSRVLPAVIIGTLLAVLVLYGLIGWVLSATIGVEALAFSAAPLAELAPSGLAPVVIAAAALASLGSLAAILAGLSRTSMAMAQAGDLPARLGFVWSRTSSPVVAELVMGMAAVAVVLFFDPLWLVGASSGAVLSYYAIAHWSAIRQPAPERVLPSWLPWVGLVGCTVLVVTLPWQSVIATAVAIVLVLGVWSLRARRGQKLG